MCLPACDATFQEQRARAARGVVGGGRRPGVLRSDADHLRDHAAHLGRRVELPLALATLGGEVPHQVLVGVAEDVVVLGAVLREVELGLLEDADQVGQAIHHRLAFAELVGVVEVGEVAAGEARVGFDQRLDDLGVDLVADVGLALEGDHVGETRALGDRDRRREVGAVAVLVADVLDEQHEQDVVLVLTGVHAAAEFIAGSPDGAVKFAFLDCHFSDYTGYVVALPETLNSGVSPACLRRSAHDLSSFLSGHWTRDLIVAKIFRPCKGYRSATIPSRFSFLCVPHFFPLRP